MDKVTKKDLGYTIKTQEKNRVLLGRYPQKIVTSPHILNLS